MVCHTERHLISNVIGLMHHNPTASAVDSRAFGCGAYMPDETCRGLDDRVGNHECHFQ